MKRRLLIKLLGIIAIGTMLLFGLVNYLVQTAELQMSFIEQEHRQTLREYARTAERLYHQDQQQLLAWVQELERKEDTWAAVATASIHPEAGTKLSQKYLDDLRLGRSVDWKIHLYFDWSPVLSMEFEQGNAHFLIQLPPRMRPGGYWPQARWLLQTAFPFILLCLLSWVLYRYMMAPLRQLQHATRQFRDGQFAVRLKPLMKQRKDEFTELAESFDQMAERTEKLIISQRQMLADLSHELRTPLTRMDMAVDYVEQGIQPQQALARLRNESAAMRELVEDALTLAWLDTESPRLHSDDFDLVELLDVICDNARFEHPDRELISQLPQQASLCGSSQRALGQALENVIRNAMSYTPAQGQVLVLLERGAQKYYLWVCDQGPGVAEHLLEDIFEPFFRVDDARSAPKEQTDKALKRRGFGLGLALAQRQIAAVGGCISASNGTAEMRGLEVRIELPQDSSR